jgi:hypothetical protein
LGLGNDTLHGCLAHCAWQGRPDLRVGPFIRNLDVADE